MTSYRGKAWDLIDQELAANSRLGREVFPQPVDSEPRQMLRRERREIIDRVIALASLDGLELPHPPVPEQAATAEQAAWIAENQDLWAGWQSGRWPARDDLDPRGYRWEAMP